MRLLPSLIPAGTRDQLATLIRTIGPNHRAAPAHPNAHAGVAAPHHGVPSPPTARFTYSAPLANPGDES